MTGIRWTAPVPYRLPCLALPRLGCAEGVDQSPWGMTPGTLMSRPPPSLALSYSTQYGTVQRSVWSSWGNGRETLARLINLGRDEQTRSMPAHSPIAASCASAGSQLILFRSRPLTSGATHFVTENPRPVVRGPVYFAKPWPNGPRARLCLVRYRLSDSCHPLVGLL